jgi:hypothetical protein
MTDMGKKLSERLRQCEKQIGLWGNADFRVSQSLSQVHSTAPEGPQTDVINVTYHVEIVEAMPSPKSF